MHASKGGLCQQQNRLCVICVLCLNISNEVFIFKRDRFLWDSREKHWAGIQRWFLRSITFPFFIIMKHWLPTEYHGYTCQESPQHCWVDTCQIRMIWYNITCIYFLKIWGNLWFHYIVLKLLLHITIVPWLTTRRISHVQQHWRYQTFTTAMHIDVHRECVLIDTKTLETPRK